MVVAHVCKDRIAIVEEIPRCLVLRKGVTKLLCRPGRSRMLRDGYVDESSTIVLEDHQDKEQPKRHCGYHEEVGGHDLVRMIREEGPPRLRRRPPLRPHVFSNGRLTHRDAQLLELSVDARRAAERI